MLAAGSCQIVFAGEQLSLLPERAVWWPAARTLFIADLHLGKAATYRSLGQPVPGGSTQENLARIDRLIEALAPLQIVFLGDFLHAAQARTPSLLAVVADWSAGWSARWSANWSAQCSADDSSAGRGLICTLVRGNHDKRAGDPPASLGFELVDEPHLLGPYAACHHPQHHDTHAVLAGHLHPAIKLHGRGRDSLRMPCFVREGDALLILPAFGEFTGGWEVERRSDRRFYGVGAQAVWALPT
ncbi:MAG: ligase-associated DNA damage response endonuclease PdeM [Ideonella sp.]